MTTSERISPNRKAGGQRGSAIASGCAAECYTAISSLNERGKGR